MNVSYRGLFTPKFPAKYLGDSRNIVYRSLWERQFMRYCDETSAIRRWASEEFYVPYVSPVDGRIHRYFPDFMLEVQAADGVKKFVIEIKPKYQTAIPRERKRQSRKYLAEVAKWDAAKEFCAKQGLTFLVLTEDDLFTRFK
jgi:TnsA endonuclease N terminal